MRIPTGINPDQQWTVDLCQEAARYAVEIAKAVVEKAKADTGENAAEQLAAAEAFVADAERELAAYVLGAGPIFTIGHISGPARAEIAGMIQEAHDATPGRAQFAAQHTWRREVVRAAVRGHRNLKGPDGAELPFDGTPIAFAGATVLAPSEKQLERYTPFLADLAAVCLRAQRLTDPEKKA